MVQILVEWSFHNAFQLHVQYKDFKCKPDTADCCHQWILYNQPDFANVISLLEETCQAWSFDVIFLPKFHCELNFIEQCWGYAKRIYHMCPVSSKEIDLENNVITSLDSIPIDSMCR